MQHVHGCLLKQPSSAKKAAPAAVATAVVTPRTERLAGISSRSTELSRGSAGSSRGTPTPDSAPSRRRDSGAVGAGESGSAGRGGCFPAPTEGPRPTRVSLQGVFSPKVNNRTSYLFQYHGTLEYMKCWSNGARNTYSSYRPSVATHGSWVYEKCVKPKDAPRSLRTQRKVALPVYGSVAVRRFSKP